MTCALCLENFKDEAFLGSEFKSMVKKLDSEFTVDVMEFRFIFAIVLF